MADASTDTERLRHGLLDQLRHLARETEMLRGVIGRVPEKLLAEAPPNEPRSIKETFALSARLDETIHPRRIERVVEEDTPRLPPVDAQDVLAGEDWNALPITDLLDRVRDARETLVTKLESLPPSDWQRIGRFPAERAEDGASDGDDFEERDLYEMAHALCRHDTARLEAMTQRLYESHMGPAPERGGPA